MGKRAFLLLGSLMVTLVAANAANVTLNKPVTLNGSYPLYTYPNAPCGTNPPQATAATLVDGVFLPEGTCFQNGTVYWAAANQTNTLDVDLGGTFTISSATFQGDNNDAYTVQYRDVGGVYHDWWVIPASSPPPGLLTRPNTADTTQQQALPPVIATGIRVLAPAGSGDGFYSVSEIAVFGDAAPVPVFSKAFAPASIQAGANSQLTFTLTNPSATVALTGLAFTDPLPAGVVVATPNGLSTTCAGTVTAVAGSTSISLSAGTLAVSASCTITVTVTGTSGGTKVNTTSTLTSNQTSPGTAAVATLVVAAGYVTADSPFQVSYAANPSSGESFINIINTGASGAPLLGPGFGGTVGNICANVYTFSPDEQLISCCSCLVTPNSVVNLGVNRDLTIKTLTGVIPTSVTVKLLATLAGERGSGTTCNNTAANSNGQLATGMIAYGTTAHLLGATPNIVEHTFVPSTLSAGELASITGRCSAILGNGSGFGVCKSCQLGALGGDKK